MGVQRDVGGKPSIPPSSFWAQRSAQPAGIHKNVLSKCIRIVIVAFGSAPILDYRRFAHGLRWAAAQTCLRDFIPQTPFFASRGFKILNQQSAPLADYHIHLMHIVMFKQCKCLFGDQLT